MQAWVAEMSAFVKRVDPNHLVTIGEEGFFASDRPEARFLLPRKICICYSYQLGGQDLAIFRVSALDGHMRRKMIKCQPKGGVNDNITHQSRAVFMCSCDKTRCRGGKKTCWQRLAATPHARQLRGMFGAPTSAVPRLAHVHMRVGYLQMQVGASMLPFYW